VNLKKLTVEQRIDRERALAAIAEFVPVEQFPIELCHDLDAGGSLAGGPAPAGPAAAGGPPPPPVGNTGGKLTGQEISLGWLQGTFPTVNLGRVRELVSWFLGPCQDRERGTNAGYTRSARWETAGLLGWDDGRAEAWLSLNAESIAALTADQVCELLGGLRALAFRVTRFDSTFDDYDRKLLVMDQVHQAAEAGQVVGFKVYDPRRPRDVRTGKLRGDTAYFGRRGGNGSGKFVRFYDKGLESDGQVNSVRFECEFSGEVAFILGEHLLECETPDELRRCLRSSLAGCIDFRDRTGAHGHRDRMPRLAWWQQVLDVLGPADVVKVRRIRPPLMKFAEYVRDTLGRSLAKVCQVIEEQGHDAIAVLSELIDRARPAAAGWRLGASHLGIDVAALLTGGKHGGESERVKLSDWLAIPALT
jgi:hypothetical protein